MCSEKNERRGRREVAVKTLNCLAEEFEVDAISARPKVEDAVNLYTTLCDTVPAERAAELCAARDLWIANGGGGAFPEAPGADQDAEDGPDGRERDPGHSECRPLAGQAFWLKSKAFMLTFNCLAFVASPELWQAYQAWVEDRRTTFGITYWSATMEESVHSTDTGRVHLHCYFLARWRQQGSEP